MTAVDAQNGVDDVTGYADGVRAALGDLPAEAREELLEDLPAHLAEVLAEDTGSLTERLGPPAAYAAELRAAAGIDDGARQRPGLGSFPPTTATVVEWLQVTDRRLGRLLGYDRATDYARLLRPAWWLLRGYAVGMLLVGALQGHPALLPPLAVGCLLVLPMVIGSIRLGSLTARVPETWRVPVWTATGGLVLLILLNMVVIDGRYHEPIQSSPDRFADVTNVHPYDREGRPLTEVRLYDQNGRPLEIGDIWRCPVPPDTAGAQHAPIPDFAAAYRYPLCHPPEPTTGTSQSPGPSVDPSPSVVASPGASPAR